MKIAVLGAGAVGSYFGGRLAEAGHDVKLIGRKKHVDAVRTSGLKIRSIISASTISHPNASEIISVDPDTEILLLTVKAFDTEVVARSIEALTHRPKLVLSLQNGVENHIVIAKVLKGVQVYPTVIYVGVGMSDPGEVRHFARGEIVLPEELHGLVEMFDSAGIRATTTGNIIGMLWEKLALNASLNAVSMITNMSFEVLVADLDVRHVVRAAAEEVLAVAESLEIEVGVVDPVAQAQSLGPSMSSMCQDYQAGKRIEIEALNGFVSQRGCKQGIPTPVNSTLCALAELMFQQKSGVL